MLGTPPDWSLLDPYQHRISKRQFLFLLQNIYTIGNDWEKHFTVHEDHISILTGNAEAPTYCLYFAPKSPSQPLSPATFWELNPKRSLRDLHIAIDPGHLGGKWAQIEERWFQIGNGTPVEEGTLTLQTAQHLKTMLEQKGATVSLIRSNDETIAQNSANHYLKRLQKREGENAEQHRRRAEKLVYRTEEIRNRAALVNHDIQPDLVLCLHYNALAWGDPEKPQLTDTNHLHVLINGAYTTSELAHHDERFELVRKILGGNAQHEIGISQAMIKSFQETTQLPLYEYASDSRRAIRISDGVWARNLLANRLYQCPVIFLEPYIMNSHEVYDHVQYGDYEGQKMIHHRMRASITREYAGCVTRALEQYFQP